MKSATVSSSEKTIGSDTSSRINVGPCFSCTASTGACPPKPNATATRKISSWVVTGRIMGVLPSHCVTDPPFFSHRSAPRNCFTEFCSASRSHLFQADWESSPRLEDDSFTEKRTIDDSKETRTSHNSGFVLTGCCWGFA